LGKHDVFMHRAIELAKQAPGAPFGSVVVNRSANRIVAEGLNRTADCPIWHGEMDAIHNCTAQTPSFDFAGHALYTTAEPCPMCQSAICWAGFTEVYFGTSIPFLIKEGWGQIEIRAEEVARLSKFVRCKITGGILESDCNLLYVNRKRSP